MTSQQKVSWDTSVYIHIHNYYYYMTSHTFRNLY